MPVMLTAELALVNVNVGRVSVGSAVSRGIERVQRIGARGLFRGASFLGLVSGQSCQSVAFLGAVWVGSRAVGTEAGRSDRSLSRLPHAVVAAVLDPRFLVQSIA